MASGSPRNIVLLPIHPHFAARIMRGEKRVEFRKARFPKHVTHVVVYATSPVQRVLGYFEVSEVVQASPSSLWRKFRAIGGIERKAFNAYYAAEDRGVAITVKRVWPFSRPKPIGHIHSTNVVPQSFAYLPPSRLRSLKTAAACRITTRPGICAQKPSIDVPRRWKSQNYAACR